MKTLVINKNTLHYWLANKYGKMSEYDESVMDLCSYTRRVVSGAGWFILHSIAFLLVAAFVSVAVVDMVLGIAFYIATGMFLMQEPGITLLAAIIVIALLVLYIFVKDKIEQRVQMTEQKEPGLVVQAYRSWKEKYCVKIEFNKEATNGN